MKIALICLGRCKDENGVKSIYSKIFSVERVNIIERINFRNPLNQKIKNREKDHGQPNLIKRLLAKGWMRVYPEE